MPDMSEMDLLLQALIRQAMQKDSAGPGMELAQRDAMGPEAYKEFINTNTFGDRAQLARQGTQDQMGLLNNQYAQAQEASRPQGKNYGSVAGNIIGGLGDIVRQVGGGMQMRNIGGQQKALLDNGQATQGGLLDRMDQSNLASTNGRDEAMRKFLALTQGQQQPPPDPMGAAGGMGGGGIGIAPGGAANFGMAQLQNPLLGLFGM